MVYSVILKWLSFKADLSSTASMLANQQSTYAILRHAKDVPDKIFKESMEKLKDREGWIGYRKLEKLVKEYKKVSRPMLMVEEDEIVETLEIKVGIKNTDDMDFEDEDDFVTGD